MLWLLSLKTFQKGFFECGVLYFSNDFMNNNFFSSLVNLTFPYICSPFKVWPSVDVWTSFSITLVLDNVTLELDHVGKHEAQACSPLACINFIRSRLTFESFSDESKDVDLVSQEILISDTRFEGKQQTVKKARCNIYAVWELYLFIFSIIFFLEAFLKSFSHSR